MIRVQRFTENEIKQLFGLMQSCTVPEFYIILEENQNFYESVARNKLSLCVINEAGDLIASLLCRRNIAELYDFRNQCTILGNALNNNNVDNSIEFMNCCVREDYRGHHLESSLINKNLKLLIEDNSSLWAWCVVHKDNIPSVKSVLSCGFTPIIEDITLQYNVPHYHRNIYFWSKEN